MDLKSLHYFVTMADELHFGRAARRLYITQPGLSQGIKALERKLGVQLFDRGRQEVTLTEAGELLLPSVRQLLAQADEVGRLAEHIASTQHGVLRVSHPPTTGIGLAVRLAAAFRRVHSEISLHTVSGYNTVNAERVCSREVDIGFVYPPVDLADELCSSVLTHERVVVAMPSGHPLARRATMRTAELADLPLVQCPPARTTGLWESMLAAVYGIDRPPTVTRVEPDEPHMLAAVAERAGIGLLTEAAARILNVPGVITRPFDASVTVPLGVIWRRDNANPAVRLYLGLARDLERLEDGIMLRYVEPAVRTGA